MSARRVVDLTDPGTWEFCGFSQNGEDGILDVLRKRLRATNRYFVEIGASDGLENNTAWLAFAERFSGIMVEGDAEVSQRSRSNLESMNYGVEFMTSFMTTDNASSLRGRALHVNPDVFSIDVDGNDYHLVVALLNAGFRPKIFVVEYNSAFGPDDCLTVPYRADFQVAAGHGNSLYYGCSIGSWRKLFHQSNYQFVTVEGNGVNAFFVDSAEFEPDFLEQVRGVPFRENFSHAREYHGGWRQQRALLKDRPLLQTDQGHR